MIRLTERLVNDQAVIIGCGYDCKYEYDYCDNVEDCPKIKEVAEKLARHEEAEEEGKLLMLPCKPGDTAYILHRGHIQEISVISASVDLNGFWYFNWIIKDDKGAYHGYGVHVFYDRQIGKTVFLTEQEAKEALEGMEK